MPPLLAAAERRSSVRYRCPRVCFARPNGTGLGVTWGATLRDISAEGVSLFLPRELRPGTVLAIQPPRAGRGRVLVARLVWAVPQAGGWCCGCRLVEPLSADELQDWLI